MYPPIPSAHTPYFGSDYCVPISFIPKFCVCVVQNRSFVTVAMQQTYDPL